MSVKNEFSKHANEYNSYNIIQQLVAKSLIRDILSKPKRILELGCGSGQIYKNITWNVDYYKAIDFSSSMCSLHPRAKNLEVKCFDFDSSDFRKNIKNDKYDVILSSSALQWSKDLNKILKLLSSLSNEMYAVLFTSNTFKSIQELTRQKSPILSSLEIKEAFSNNFSCEFEILNYNLEFDNKKDIFKYIKNSGVSGNSKLSFKEAKLLYKNYDLNYLEFEVIFIKAFSKS